MSETLRIGGFLIGSPVGFFVDDADGNGEALSDGPTEMGDDAVVGFIVEDALAWGTSA